MQKLVITPIGLHDATLAIGACRAGGVGILDLGLADKALSIELLGVVSRHVESAYGAKFVGEHLQQVEEILPFIQGGLSWVVVDAELFSIHAAAINTLRTAGVGVLAEVRSLTWPGESLDGLADGLLIKGNEAAGFVGESSSFILFQRWIRQTKLPLYVLGGVTPLVAAACEMMGATGVAFESQVLLFDESPVAEVLAPLIKKLSGNEAQAIGDGEKGEYFRLLVRPTLQVAKTFADTFEGALLDELRSELVGKVRWDQPEKGLIPLGQDVRFAGEWQEEYGRLADLFRAVDRAIEAQRSRENQTSLSEDSPLARELGTTLPIVQGPMTRVSDSVAFADQVSRAGGLPMLAVALLKGQPLDDLLSEAAETIVDRPWGIGLLGFAPRALLDLQIESVRKYKPGFAIIAGGRPDQALGLEKVGIPSFLHVPSSNLIPLFLKEGARRFIFEGRECGGHVGPLNSFVLWSDMVVHLLKELESSRVEPSEVHVLLAGGIHDATSSAIAQAIMAPLARIGVNVGVLMGSAYLFSKEIVESGALVPGFQEVALDCEQTVNLQSGTGHASRCAYTSFASSFFEKRAELIGQNVPSDEARETLDDLILGRLRVASKGSERTGENSELVHRDESYQHSEGMYMLGQVATLRRSVTDVSALHKEVINDAAKIIQGAQHEAPATTEDSCESSPDVAIIGIGCLLPKAGSTTEYWENILNRVNAITEIPSHRWDWRLYFSEDRNEKDKIYSRWGGFIDDMLFDPTTYGMPPKSIESVDPMQLMALEVASQTLIDAGYAERPFDREKASVIIGASGGAGDVGMQYGVRAETPRFDGELTKDVADRLPEWTEDTFAGILLNVVAGRIANRLNFGGLNYTTDAACASSLAAVYQGVNELVAGRSDLVIAGGVDTVQGPFGYMCFSKTQALSPRGQCNTFDQSADGIVISEGIAMVALKRLDDAKRDGDRIYSVIKGIAGSSDGGAKGMTAPLPEGQLRAMRRAYQQAGFGAQTVGLFEAHGTGTVAGDSAELESTTTLLRESGGSPHQSVIGSVKTLIGHTKATAGIAGMIKSALALHHKILPPHYGVKSINTVLGDSESPLYLINSAKPWLASLTQPRRAACSAFGFGGTNFHVVMEEYADEYRSKFKEMPPTERWPAELMVWAAADKAGLVEELRSLKTVLSGETEVELRDVAYSCIKNISQEEHRAAVVAANVPDLLEKLDYLLGFLLDTSPALVPGVYYRKTLSQDAKTAVLFSGQGSQYPNMMAEIACYFPRFADFFGKADIYLADRFSDKDKDSPRLSDFIFPKGDYNEVDRKTSLEKLTSTDVAQPALGVTGSALWYLMGEFGLKADMLGGHSYGEFVALYASGALSYEDLLLVSEARGRHIVEVAADTGVELGDMAAVKASREVVEEGLAKFPDVIVANHNAPDQCIISGSTESIDQALKYFAAAAISATKIPVAAAFHSKYVSAAQEPLAKAIADLEWREGRIPVYSNSSATIHSTDLSRLKENMSEHLVKPVEFVAEIESMYADGARTFIELGPKSVLSKLIAKILGDREHVSVAVDDGSGSLNALLKCFGQLFCAGVELEFSALFDQRQCRQGDLEKLGSLRRKAVPKTAWMLNGSRARRYSDPVGQVGLRLEDLDSKPLTETNQSPINNPQAATTDDRIVEGARSAHIESTEASKMGVERKMVISSGTDVMSEYFATMRQFLEVQESVMSMCLGQYSGKPKQGTRVASSLSRPQVDMPPLRPVVPQAPMVDLYSGEKPSLQKAAEAASLSPTVIAEGPVIAPPVNVAQANTAQAVVDPEGAFDTSKLTSILLDIVEDKTGYPKDMLDLEQNLEADLGIDSIKRVEIVGSLLMALPDSYSEALSEDDRAELNTQATLSGLLDLLNNIKVDA